MATSIKNLQEGGDNSLVSGALTRPSSVTKKATPIVALPQDVAAAPFVQHHPAPGRTVELSEKQILPSETRPLNGNDPFWGDDISILVEKSRLVEFFPTADQSLAERVNSITRMVLYISGALAVYQGKSTALHFGILIVLVIYFMWKNKTISFIGDEMNVEKFNNKDVVTIPKMQRLPSLEDGECIMPTAQNPFMNYLVGDNPNRPGACKGPGVQEMAANMLDDQLFNDVDDVFSKNANQRLFRTMPSTTRVPEREKFASWLIKGENNCKEDNMCPPYDDPKMQRNLIPEDLDEDFSVTGFTF